MKTLLFIYNPHSGNGRVKLRLSEIIDTFVKSGYRVTVYPTQTAHDAISAAASMGAMFDRVVCSGGDGTLSETAAGLMRLPADLRPTLGFIPAGTTNDCARNLELPKGMEKAAAVAAGGYPRQMDMGKLNRLPFFYVAAFGNFTDVAYDTPQDLKKVFGHMAYLLAAVNALPELTYYPLRIEYDGGVIEDDFLVGLVCNSFSVGGVEPFPADKVCLDDGLFEVILLKTMGNVLQVGETIQAALSRKLTDTSKLVFLRTSRLKITHREGGTVPWTIDGEYGGSLVESNLKNCRRCLTVVHGKPAEESAAEGAAAQKAPLV